MNGCITISIYISDALPDRFGDDVLLHDVGANGVSLHAPPRPPPSRDGTEVLIAQAGRRNGYKDGNGEGMLALIRVMDIFKMFVQLH